MRALAREGQGGKVRRLRQTLVCVGSFALAVGGARPALALPGVAAIPADSSRGFVQLAVAGSDDDAAALVEALRELVGRLGLGLHAARADASHWANGAPPADRDERARVFIDDRFADRIEITMSAVKDGTPTAAVKRSVPRAESTAIVVEQVAYAVHSTLESLLSTGAPPPEPTPPEPIAPPVLNVPPPEPPVVAVSPTPPVDALPAPVRRNGFGIAVAGFASGRGMVKGVGVAPGGGVAADVTAWRGQWRPSLWVGASYNGTFGVTDPGIVKLATSVTSLRALPSIELLELSFLQVDIGAGGGVDAFYTVPVYVTTPPPPDVTGVVKKNPTTHWDPVLTGQVVARIRVISSARILVGFDVDYDMHRPSYTAELSTGGAYNGAFTPAAVRPSAMIGLCVPLVGSVACAGDD